MDEFFGIFGEAFTVTRREVELPYTGSSDRTERDAAAAEAPRSASSQLNLGPQGSARPLRLSRDLRAIPFDRYRLPKDGRKWKAVARERMALAEWLATHGDPDGSRISPAVDTMKLHFGWSRGKLFYLLADLRELHLLESKGLVGERGRRERRMNIAAFLTRGQRAEVQHSEPKSKIREPKSNITLDRTVLLTVQTENQNLAAHTAASPAPSGQSGSERNSLTAAQARFVAIGKLAVEGEKVLRRRGKSFADADCSADLKQWAATLGAPYDSDAISKAFTVAEQRIRETRVPTRATEISGPASLPEARSRGMPPDPDVRAAFRALAARLAMPR